MKQALFFSFFCFGDNFVTETHKKTKNRREEMKVSTIERTRFHEVTYVGGRKRAKKTMPSNSEVMRLCGIKSKATLSRWKKNDMRPESVAKRLKSRGRKSMLSEASRKRIIAVIKARCSKRQSVSADFVSQALVNSGSLEFPPSKSWVSEFLHKNGFSSRRTRTRCQKEVRPELENEILEFQKKIKEVYKRGRRIYVMDETATNRFNIPARTFDRKGAAGMQGELVRDAEGGDFRDTSVATLCNDGSKLTLYYIPSIAYKKATKKNPEIKSVRGMNKILFEKWVQEIFLVEVKPKSILIMDNLACHKDSIMKKRMEDAGHTVLFLPTYSAKKTSPCDNAFFAEFKKKLEKLPTPKDQIGLEKNARDAYESITAQHVRNYFSHCKLPVVGKVESSS